MFIKKGVIFGDIRSLFENEKQEENSYKAVRVSNFWSNNYIENECKSQKNLTRGKFN